jgi:monofunctional biosynthetic peptidoglycan transglycosylase
MRLVRRLLFAVLVLIALPVGWLFFVWPPPAWYRTHWPAETAFMRLRSGQAAEAHTAIARRYTPVDSDSMSAWLRKAATFAEDDAFYAHHGIDWRQMRQVVGYQRKDFTLSDARDRAELRRVLGNAWDRRDRLRGASTITQQLAKNLYLSPSRNPLRKLKEAVVAYELEWALPKDRILTLYLNVAEFGANLWGVEAASRAYLGHGARDLSMDQAALLIATLPHPLTSNPLYRPGRTRWRQAFILRRLRGERVEMPVEAADDSTKLGHLPADAPADTARAEIPVVDPAAAPGTGLPAPLPARDSMPR